MTGNGSKYATFTNTKFTTIRVFYIVIDGFLQRWSYQ